MVIQKTNLFTVLIPALGYKISRVDKSEMYESTIYLGKYDSPNNYIEVTNLEYNDWKEKKENENQNLESEI